MASKQLLAGHHDGMSRGSTPSVVFGKDGMACTPRGWAMSNERAMDSKATNNPSPLSFFVSLLV
jgi:hypothetical protein